RKVDRLWILFARLCRLLPKWREAWHTRHPVRFEAAQLLGIVHNDRAKPLRDRFDAVLSLHRQRLTHLFSHKPWYPAIKQPPDQAADSQRDHGIESIGATTGIEVAKRMHEDQSQPK